MSTEIPDSLIEKVKKILRLADTTRGATEAEAAVAWEKAQKLMMEHGLTMAGLNAHKSATDKSATDFNIVEVSMTLKSGERPQHRFIYQILMHCFGIRIIRWKRTDPTTWKPVLKLAFMGTPEDVAIAEYVFTFIDRVMLKGYREWLDRTGAPNKASGWNGYFDGVASGYNAAYDKAKGAVAQAENANAFALVLRDKKTAVDRFFEQHHSDCKTSKPSSLQINRAAFGAGFVKGESLKIHRPVA